MAAFALRHHNPVTTGALVFAFWLGAALLIVTAHRTIEPLSPAACTVTTIAILITASYGYTRVAAQQAGITHALGVGIAWLVLSIAAEMLLSPEVHHGWFYLLGSPTRPLIRNIDLFLWIFAPALFARGEETQD